MSDISERFPVVFEDGETKNDGDVDEEINYNGEKEFQEQYSLYSMMYTAAGESYLDIPKVGKSPAMEFLFFMNFYKQKTQLDNARIRTK